MRDSCVYWIHLPTHTNMLEQGYIGITSQPFAKRIQQHKTAALKNKLPIHRAILKHSDDLIFEKILIGSLEYCLLMENRLRPVVKIAWNVGIGGSATTKGYKQSAEFCQKQSMLRKGKPVSEKALISLKAAAKLRGMPSRTIELAALKNSSLNSWENPIGKKNIESWAKASVIFDIMEQHPEMGSKNIARMLETTYSKIAVIFKKIREGWVPRNDPDWLLFSSSTKLTPDTLEISPT